MLQIVWGFKQFYFIIASDIYTKEDFGRGITPLKTGRTIRDALII